MLRYACRSCGRLLSPLPGDCCVFCSYGDVDCEGKPIVKVDRTSQARST